jgi:hypothetical protein
MSETTHLGARQALGQERTLQLVSPVLDLDTHGISGERICRVSQLPLAERIALFLLFSVDIQE